MSEVRAFVRRSGMANADAIALSLPRDAVVSELAGAAVRQLWPQDAAPTAAEVRVCLDGCSELCRNRQAVLSCTSDLADATFVVDTPRSMSREQQRYVAQPKPGAHQERGDEASRRMTGIIRSPSPRRGDVVSPSRARSVQMFAGAAEGSIATLASGEGMPVQRSALEHRRRAAGHEVVRCTASSLPVNMHEGGALGTRRDDALTMVTGDVHSQCDPPRYRRVHGPTDPPHLRSSADDWWGHRGGYSRQTRGTEPHRREQPPHAERPSCRGPSQDAPEAVTGSWLHSEVIPRKGPGLAAPASARDSHVATEGGHIQPAQGHGVPFYDRPKGKRQQAVRAQCCQLDGTLGSLAETRTGRRHAPNADEHSTLWEPECEQSKRQSEERHTGIPVPYGTSGDSAVDGPRIPRTHPTNQSSMTEYMSVDASGRVRGDASVEQEMVRKGRAGWAGAMNTDGEPRPPPLSVPRDASPHAELREYVSDRVAASSGHTRSDLTTAWRELVAEAAPAGARRTAAADRGVDVDSFRKALRRLFGVDVSAQDVPGLLRRAGDGAATARVTFREFADLCKQQDRGASSTRDPSGDRGLKCRGLSDTSGRAPYGTVHDTQPQKHLGRRVDAGRMHGHSDITMLGHPSGASVERSARRF
eukprot:TRINITY_DN12124_c0_g1_i1.p1 TRINITY_DN12124_c0_g1~~TRINITY_DN12124_c0_g1_i1.p1  ORF type:complete len:663 (+),score=108.37 TRINITY_DN12124_c0_g1_i1:60-1991(+)